jgi:hypothetical protein
MTPAAERPNDGDRARPATGRARSAPVVLVEPRAEWVELGRGLDLDEYVEVKDSATDVLMLAAERWAAATGWGPPA